MRFRRWLAWKLVDHLEWLERLDEPWRPRQSIFWWWYTHAYHYACVIHPMTNDQWHRHYPRPGGLGMNAWELSMFFNDVEHEER